MTGAPNGIEPPPGAPVEMLVNTTFQMILTIVLFVGASVVVLVGVRRPVRMRDWAELRFRLLILAGGALSTFVFEAAADRMGQVWYYNKGRQFQLTSLFGIDVPLWALPVYVGFVGGGVLFIIVRVRSGPQQLNIVKMFAALVIANLVIEIPILKFGGLYEYWSRGNQPLWHRDLFPMPLWFIIINSMLLFIVALIIVSVMATGIRHIEWAIPVVFPGAMYAAYGLAGWPVITALQDGGSLLVTTVCGLLTVTLAIGFTILTARVLPRLGSQVALTSTYENGVRRHTPRPRPVHYSVRTVQSTDTRT